jgi:outer membrane receptor for ferrienterochelin and colicins
MARRPIRSLLLASIPLPLVLGVIPTAAFAADATSDAASVVIVTAKKLDAARDTIQPQVGASTYTITHQAIETLPGGQNTPLNQVILQAPGVDQDSFGQLHVRGEHNDLQYRLNGVILPEGLAEFSQTLSPRIADKVELITGALPAEYGLRNAGIIDITTKSGAYQNGGSISVYGGSHGEIEPSFEFEGNSGNTNFYVSGSYLQNDLGIDSPDGRSDPIHDHTQQFQGFAYLETILDPQSRISVILGTSDQKFQIPDVSGGSNGGFLTDNGSSPFLVDGHADFPSQDLNENQRENTQYGVVSYLHAAGRFTGQASVFTRYSTLTFTPDELGDILYNGVAQNVDKTETAFGLQAEGEYALNDRHTLRGGVLVQAERETTNTNSEVVLLDATTGAELSPTAPFAPDPNGALFDIVDNTAKTAWTYSAYLQDEWKLQRNLTLNYGARFDQYDGFRDENQLSPRVNLVWLPTPATTIHIGYARYFSTPQLEFIGPQSVQKFIEPIPGDSSITTSGTPLVTQFGATVATVQCPLVTKDTAPYAERADYYDLGASQKIGPNFTLTIDSYLKLSKHLIDEGQFGAPILLTPFNYENGRQYGVELTGSYVKGPFSAYANFSYSIAQGENWITSQFDFPQAQIDYLMNHYIYLDHNEKLAVSAGASYLWLGTRFSFDMIYGSGLRTDLPLAVPHMFPDGSVLTDIPNGAALPGYVQVNLSLSHRFETAPGGPIEVRFDVINLFDEVYEIRDGSGVGVFASQFGPRRGFFAGVTKSF